MSDYTNYSKNKNKIAVLYILNAFSKEMDKDQIWRCITEFNIMNYLDFNESLFELIDRKMISKSTVQDNQFYRITEKGISVLNEFQIELGKSIRNNIDHFIKNNKKQYLNEMNFTSNMNVSNSGIYTVTLKMLYEHNTFFEINMKYNSRDEAVCATKKWTESGKDIYSFVFNQLSKEQ